MEYIGLSAELGEIRYAIEGAHWIVDSVAMGALKDCDASVLVLPCGRSAHLELGYAVGAGKRSVVLLAEGEPELMLAMADQLCLTVERW